MVITPYVAEWEALSARIDGLLRAGEFFYKTLDVKTGDKPDLSRRVLLTGLLPESRSIFNRISEFGSSYSSSLPTEANACLRAFQKMYVYDFKPVEGETPWAQCLVYIQIRLTSLACLRSELEYFVSGEQQQIRTAAERAFMHLNRCLVVDLAFRSKWQKAFEFREDACEKLGAIHLLWHGIYAFKVGAGGARTDLVMGNRVDNPSEAAGAVGLVLTEWKVARTSAEVEKKYEEAKQQASLYTVGVLAGIELVSPRYLIVVTKDTISAPSDIVEGDVTYRHVNIAINPRSPSKVARSA